MSLQVIEVRFSRGNIPFEGLIVNLERRYRESNSDLMKEWMGKFMTVHKCEACQGKRLRPEVLAVTVGGKNIAELSDLPVRDALSFVENLELSEKDMLSCKGRL